MSVKLTAEFTPAVTGGPVVVESDSFVSARAAIAAELQARLAAAGAQALTNALAIVNS